MSNKNFFPLKFSQKINQGKPKSICITFIKHRFYIPFYFGLIKKLCILNFRRKPAAVQYTESSDSEEVEPSELPQKMKGNMK